MDPFIGEVRPMAFDWAPQDWALCNGATVPLAQYQALAAIIGTLYGGDGRTTIGLPNLQGRIPLGAGNGPNLTPHRVAATGGIEAVTLTPAQMAPHQHAINSKFSGPPTDVSAIPDATMMPSRTINQFNYSTTDINPWTTTTGFDPVTISMTGGSPTAAHNNMQPWQCINFCIALQGVWPEKP